jgi:hypothetical protein
VLLVVGFEEHLELDADGVLEWQYHAVFGVGDRRVGHVEMLEPCQPPVADDQVEFGELKQCSSPSGAGLGVTDRKRNVRHPAEGWH